MTVLGMLLVVGTVHAAEILRRTVEYDFSVPSEGRATFGPAGTAHLRVGHTQVEAAQSRFEQFDRLLPMPQDATERWCELRMGEQVVKGWIWPMGCTIVGTPAMLNQELQIRWGWTEPHAPAAGVLDLQGDDPVSDAQLRFTGAQVAAAGGDGIEPITVDAGLRFGATDVPARAVDGVAAPPSYTVAWRVVAAGEQPVVPSREALLLQIAQGGLAASLPEPGIGMGFKGRRANASAIPEVLAQVRLQVVWGVLAGSHPLKPRKLMAVRRSRWATPWEQALLLARYLGQIKIPARPIPVRPRPSGFIEPAVPEGYTEAVVRVDLHGERVWLDPSCAVCAVGELRPELWGGQVLEPELMQLPDGPQGNRTLTVDLRGAAPTGELELVGAEALGLRLALADVSVRHRAASVPALAGFSGAELVNHTGITERGAPIRLVLSLTDPPEPGSDGLGLPVVLDTGSTRVDLGWPAARTVRYRLGSTAGPWAGIEAQSMQTGPLSWSRTVEPEGEGTVIVERLAWTTSVVDRATAAAFFRDVREHQRVGVSP